MKKAAAEILSGFIFNRMLRNQWRGKLRYGVRRMRELRKELDKRLPAPRYYLAVCAIAKDEGSYFKEWLDWHISKGVEKFYIHDNGSTDNTREVLEPYIEEGIVEYIYYPGYRMQLSAYDDCMERFRLDARWLAFIDLDEFIVPLKDKDIPTFLRKYENYSVVEINWLVYGSGGEVKRREGGVMERFHTHSKPEHILNRHIKSIVNPRRVYCMIGCHEAARINGDAVDSHGHIVKKSFRDRTAQADVIRINHYAVRSKEEFYEKKLRGRASGKARKVEDEYFERFDLNDIHD